MKTLAVFFYLTLTGFVALAQDVKCLGLANAIIANLQGTTQSQAVDSDEIYYIKAGFPQKLEIDAIKTICDSTAGAAKVSRNWSINYDKNFEKEYSINGKKFLVTIYYTDKFLYFEFPNR